MCQDTVGAEPEQQATGNFSPTPHYKLQEFCSINTNFGLATSGAEEDMASTITDQAILEKYSSNNLFEWSEVIFSDNSSKHDSLRTSIANAARSVAQERDVPLQVIP